MRSLWVILITEPTGEPLSRGKSSLIWDLIYAIRVIVTLMRNVLWNSANPSPFLFLKKRLIEEELVFLSYKNEEDIEDKHITSKTVANVDEIVLLIWNYHRLGIHGIDKESASTDFNKNVNKKTKKSLENIGANRES